MIFKTNKYELFLNKLNQITNIDIRILDNLYKLNLLTFIFENKKCIYNNHECYIIDNPILIKNYECITEYVLASFPLYNIQYQIKDQIYEFSSIINKYSKPKILLTSEYSSIHCYHSISLSRFSKYPIKEFNNVEKDILKNEIKKIFNKYGYLGFFSSSINKQNLILNTNYLPENYFFHNSDNLEKNHISLSSFISECIRDYHIIENEIKKMDFPIYERLILSKKIKNF